MAKLLSSVIESTVVEMTESGFPAGYVETTEKELESSGNGTWLKEESIIQKKTVRNTVRKNSAPV